MMLENSRVGSWELLSSFLTTTMADENRSDVTQARNVHRGENLEYKVLLLF